MCSQQCNKIKHSVKWKKKQICFLNRFHWSCQMKFWVSRLRFTVVWFLDQIRSWNFTGWCKGSFRCSYDSCIWDEEMLNPRFNFPILSSSFNWSPHSIDCCKKGKENANIHFVFAFVKWKLKQEHFKKNNTTTTPLVNLWSRCLTFRIKTSTESENQPIWMNRK